mgnify:CR=1 FL=1
MYHHFIKSVQLKNQTLIKKSQIEKVINAKIKWRILSALKASLYYIETEFALTDVKYDTLKKNEILINPYTILAEQKKNAFFKIKI